MSQGAFVKIVPIEYDMRAKEKHKNPRIMYYRNIEFSPHLDLDSLERIIREKKHRRKISVSGDSKHWLFWSYEGRPTVIIQCINNEIGTTLKDFNIYHERKCQVTCAITIKMFKDYGLVSFRRVFLTLNPKLIGWTKEERITVYNAWELLHQRIGGVKKQ
jgi:hypothetical protein